MALVNVETGEALDFGLELSYYAGVEDGEAWTEGSRDARELLPSVPPGKYVLRIEPEGGDAGQAVPYTVRVRRDVTRVWYPLLALLLLLVPPIPRPWPPPTSSGAAGPRAATSTTRAARKVTTRDESDED